MQTLEAEKNSLRERLKSSLHFHDMFEQFVYLVETYGIQQLQEAIENDGPLLRLAVMYDNIKVVDCILQTGIDVHVSNGEISPLFVVESVAMTKLLLDAGIDKSIRRFRCGGEYYQTAEEYNRLMAVVRPVKQQEFEDIANLIRDYVPEPGTEYVLK